MFFRFSKMRSTLSHVDSEHYRPKVGYSYAEGSNGLFDRMVNVERIKVGNWQTIDTLISEEVLLFAKYLRNEKKEWIPRIAPL
jgi:hypothetical protein